MNILILYGSLEGQTAKIADHIAQQLRDRDYQVSCLSADPLPADFDIESYDAAIIGGSIHMGRYPKPMRKFVSQYKDWLNHHPSALYTVCMAIRSERADSRRQAEQFGENLTQEAQWQPSLMTTFAGAVKYTQYGFIIRFIMKSIAKHEGGSTDTSQDHEYTDWQAVTDFTAQFAAMLAASRNV